MGFQTAAEKAALEAQSLPAFGDVNLLGIKEKVAEALNLVGRSCIFHEYTLHDISHAEKMLQSLDWLIPEDTQETMTPADWLLLVLSIYFHDLGMLVTDSEFESREKSGFPAFRDQELFRGDTGTDYSSKVAELGEDQDRFLYQEYIRRHHADRIADWIQGRAASKYGLGGDAPEAVQKMLSGLPQVFRKDLALVCASHHLNDLDDTEKYRTASPYGNSEAETANVQYCALILRSADLLHITSDRTPSVMFRLISPRDPVSQREWAKQAAVTRVRAQKGRDAEGNFDDEAPKDTIEVFADFKDADAFFGLTSYLAYTEKQLRQVYEWADTSAQRFDLPYVFPWRRVDTSEIRAEGFEPRQLSFSLDQDKILDLLTGHTLYNDTSVVLRELIQNALDAVRLQALMAKEDPSTGDVTIEWDADNSELIVRDNGVGMAPGVIERNLLKAGASRYQEEDFKKRHPKFSPISRFGIGVLSAFMISDFVQITTCTAEEDQARQLTLRSVHGRYLVRLLEKESPAIESIGDSGTEVRLRVRKSAKFPGVSSTLKRWVVVPRCKVRAIENGKTVTEIDFDKPRAALGSVLKEAGLDLTNEDSPASGDWVKIIEQDYDGICTAFAVRWSHFFSQWEFLKVQDLPDDRLSSLAVGTCIEGVRVEEESAGFSDDSIVAITDARGLSAPKTNVARSGLDDTAARTAMLHRVYRSYLTHIAAEGEALHAKRGLSLTWAAQESEVLLDVLLENERERSLDHALEPSVLRDEIRAQPFVLVEANGRRSVEKAGDLREQERLWTIDSGLVRAAEKILREIPGEGSLHAIASTLSQGAFGLPDGVTLVGYRPLSVLYQLVLQGREARRMYIRRDQRRVDLGWERVDEQPVWLELRLGSGSAYGSVRPVYVGRRPIEIEGLEEETAIRAHTSFYLMAGSPLASWIVETYDEIESSSRKREFSSLLGMLVERFFAWPSRPDNVSSFVENILGSTVQRRSNADAIELVDPGTIVAVLEETPHKVFDTLAWLRRGEEIS